MSDPRQVQTVTARSKKKQRDHQARKYGFACSSCRRKKARCDGATPTCDKCRISGEFCEYDRGPSVAYAAGLEKRLRAFEDRFEKLRQSHSTEERDALIRKPFENIKPERARRDAASARLSEEGLEDIQNDLHMQIEPLDETSVGVDGRVCFYGKTSHYHVDLCEDDRDENEITGNTGSGEPQNNIQRKSTPSTIYATPDQNLVARRAAIPELLSEITPTVLDHLLDAYWCWAHHLHLVLNKGLFLRDLFVAGPWVTPFLVSAVLAQAARYSTSPDAPSLGIHFAGRALQLLPDDIDKGSSIATIQGLLILSARECGCGRTSQGWLYSGMAFRMMRDLGMHIDSNKLRYLSRQFSDEELALRQQVFWSCFTWDKTMSLCLGRAPTIHETIAIPSKDSLIDGREADEELWIPVLGQDQETMTAFTEQKSLGSARFTAYCALCTIIDDVLDGLYCRPHQSEQGHLLAFLDRMLERLQSWSAALSDGLFITTQDQLVLCPPIHILLLNLTYHATMILLCRPYRKTSIRAKELCTQAARMVDSLFTLHVRRFGFRFITYLQTYTMFVACTINVLDLKENETNNQGDIHGDAARSQTFSLRQEASARLNFGLEVLRQAGATPSAAKCAAVIVQLLRQKSDKTVVSPLSAGGQNNNNHQSVAPPRSNSGGQLSSNPTGPGTVWKNRAARFRQTGLNVLYEAGLPLLPTPVDADDNSHFRPHPSTSQTLQGFDQPMEANMSPTASAGLPYQFDLGANFVPDPQNRGPGVGTQAPSSGNRGIETPMRWLPENIEDDGSWMLMTDFGNGFLEL